jgi:DNA replication and repair protein RecF
MYIKKIELQNFRNYENLKTEFHPNVNLFLGQNAQGKTNLLESIYITSLGKSFRTNKDKDFIRFGEAFCRVKATVCRDDDTTVELAVNKEGKKGIKIDGVKARKLSELFEHIYIVIFSPEDLRLVKDQPENRRRFIDRELCQLKLSYYNNLNQYKRILAQRNKYLKEQHIDENVIDIWDIKLAEYGAALMIQRNDFIQRIKSISGSIHQKITAGKEKLTISYEANVGLVDTQKEQMEKIYKALKDNVEKDRKNRNTGKGPHKDDLKLTIDGIDIRDFGSKGQQRTSALSLKLAEIELIKQEIGEEPILLLDDVLSELDDERQHFLINAIKDIQVFITTTQIPAELRETLPCAKVYQISEGRIEE